MDVIIYFPLPGTVSIFAAQKSVALESGVAQIASTLGANAVVILATSKTPPVAEPEIYNIYFK